MVAYHTRSIAVRRLVHLFFDHYRIYMFMILVLGGTSCSYGVPKSFKVVFLQVLIFGLYEK